MAFCSSCGKQNGDDERFCPGCGKSVSGAEGGGMKCIAHGDKNSVAACASCGVGLCKECEAGSAWRDENNRAQCNKCSREQVAEGIEAFQSDITTARRFVRFNLVGLGIGVIVFLGFLIAGQGLTGFIAMWLICGLGLFVAMMSAGFAKRIMQSEESFGKKMAYIFVGPFAFGPLDILKSIFRERKTISKSQKALAELTPIMERLEAENA